MNTQWESRRRWKLQRETGHHSPYLVPEQHFALPLKTGGAKSSHSVLEHLRAHGSHTVGELSTSRGRCSSQNTGEHVFKDAPLPESNVRDGPMCTNTSQMATMGVAPISPPSMT